MKVYFKLWLTIVVASIVALVIILLAVQPAQAAGPGYVPPENDDRSNYGLSNPTLYATTNGVLNKPDLVINDTILLATETYTGTGTDTVTNADTPITGLSATNDSPTLVGNATTLTATITSGSNVTYTWAFGDGTLAAGNGAVVTHTYSGIDAYTAVVTASNTVSVVTTSTAVYVVGDRVCNLTKYAGNPVFSAGAPGSWDDDDVWGPTILKDGSNYKMWYTGDDGANVRQIGLATSTNGIDWTRYSNPVLQPNAGWESNGIVGTTVISDSGWYKMWYTGFDSSGVGRIGYATSVDGITWNKNSQPVLDIGSSGSWEDADVMFPTVLKEGSTFHMWYEGNDGSGQSAHRIGHATSTNGVNWTKDLANPVLDIGPPGAWDWLSAYGPNVVKVGGKYLLWYSGKTLPLAWQTGYATSDDGTNWTRHQMLIPEGPPGTFDDASADFPAAIFDSGNFKIWYSGYEDGNSYTIGYASAETCDANVVPNHFIYLPIVQQSCPAYYTDDFSDSGSGWPDDDDPERQFAYTSGQYQMWIKNPSSGWSVTPGAKATDFTAAVSARRTSGSTGRYGIIFGLNEDWSQFYMFNIGISSYSIWKYDNGWSTPDLRDWTSSGAINTGTGWNRLKVIRNGTSIAVYVNGQHLTTVTDSSFTGLRRIGLTAGSYPDSPRNFRFDNFALYPASCGVDAAEVGFEMGKPEIHEMPVSPGLDESP